MKLSFAFVLALLIASTTNLSAQLRKIPAAATDAFKQKYPNAESVEWKDKLTSFRADFNMSGASYEAKFSNKGEWQQTEKVITTGDLPAAVNDGLEKSKYSDWEIVSVAHIEYKDGHIEYRILVKRNDIEKKYLFFNTKGKLLRDAITI